jgi:cytoskeleton protein RodZ
VFEIGISLRTAREHRQLDLPAVERETRIRTKYLAALEEERFDTLPAPAYAKGFLRTYADFLGLDGQRFVDEFNERFVSEELPEAPPPVRVQRPRRLFGARLVAIPLAIGIGLFAWRLAAGGGGGGKTHQRAAFMPAMPHVRVSTAVAPPRRPAPAPPARAQIVFAASRGPCWLSVRRGSATGPLLYERMLEPGQHASFAGARLWIRIGAPWNLDAALNGKPVQLPAAVADMIVTPEAIRSL